MKRSTISENGVSEMIGTIVLIAIVVGAAAIVSVYIFSQSPAEKIPSLQASSWNDTQILSIRHDGGVPLSYEDTRIIVNCVDQTSKFNMSTAPDQPWTSWKNGDVLVYPTHQFPLSTVMIVYKGASSEVALKTFFIGSDTTQCGAVFISLVIAGFLGTPLSGPVPLTVQFMDSSTGDPVTWFWTFGDGTNSTAQNPITTYTTAGTYSVTLKVTNATGSNTLIRTNYITVNPPSPVASFNATPFWGISPLPVRFMDRSTNSPTSWLWNFGDNDSTNATNQSPVHTYSAMGTYNVSLTASNTGGSNTTTYTNYITVGKYVQGWRARYYSIEQSWAPENMVFTNNPPRINFQNDFCLANYPTTITELTDVPNWPYPYLGVTEYYSTEYDAFLKIDTSDTYTFYLESDDGSSMTLDGVTVIDNSGLHQPAVKTYSKYLTAGYYPINVKMYNHAGGADIALKYSSPSLPQQFVTNVWRITAVDPLVAGFSGTPTSGTMPLTVQFTDASTGPNATSWSWSFGDGNITGQTLQNPAHTYLGSGIFNVSLTATNDGGSNTAIRTNYVVVVPPATVSSITPVSGLTPGGTAISITGTNLIGTTSVTFGGTAATGVSVVSSTSMTATTPNHASGVVDVVVTTTNGTVTKTGAFTYRRPLKITSVSPALTKRGTALTATINGEGFMAPGTTGVVFQRNDTPYTIVTGTSVNYVGETQITAYFDRSINTRDIYYDIPVTNPAPDYQVAFYPQAILTTQN